LGAETVSNKQKIRRQQFENDTSVVGISFAHSSGADTLLAAALAERHEEVYRYAHDHASFVAPSAIVVAVTAFDVWLSECIAFMMIRRPDVTDATLPTCAKYDALCRHVGLTAPPAVRAELELAIDLRHELVHYLPRTFGPDPVPTWFKSLEDRGLFFGAGEGHRWQLSQRLFSFRLAYWAFRVVEGAALFLRDNAPPTHAGYLMLADNFTQYRRTTPPEELPVYDTRFGLSLTDAREEAPG
jgi:hypothetical protein